MAKKAQHLFENIPVLWINLDRSEERRGQMEAQFEEHNVRNTRICAVDGKALFADPAALACVQLPRDLKNSQGEVRRPGPEKQRCILLPIDSFPPTHDPSHANSGRLRGHVRAARGDGRPRPRVVACPVARRRVGATC